MALTKAIQAVFEGSPVTTGYQPVKSEVTTLVTEISNGSITQFAFNAGSAAFPGLIPAGDVDTGLFAPFANGLSISTAGIEHFRVGTAGAVTLRSKGGFGYDVGSGGAVPQITSRTTGVTLNGPCGIVTMFTAAGSATWSSFTISNTSISNTDTVIISYRSATNDYIFSTKVAANSVKVNFATTGGTASDTPDFIFTLIKASAT